MRSWRTVRRLATLVLAVPILLLSGIGGARFIGFSSQIVMTGSMEPDVARGSVVLMRPLAADDVRVGTVVLKPRPAKDGQPLAPVMHRVISVQREGDVISAATKGDANNAADPDPYVIGKSTMTPVVVLPWLGYAFAALRTPTGWLLFGILPALAHAVVALRRIWSSSGAVAGVVLADA